MWNFSILQRFYRISCAILQLQRRSFGQIMSKQVGKLRMDSPSIGRQILLDFCDIENWAGILQTDSQPGAPWMVPQAASSEPALEAAALAVNQLELHLSLTKF